jgi:hypothetical protein
MFEIRRHRTYFTHSPDKHYALSQDIENDVFDSFSIENTRFIFLAEIHPYTTSWGERDTAGGIFLLRIYTKHERPITYRLLKAQINTSSFSMEILDIEKNEVVFDSSKTTSRSDGYFADSIRSNYYRFPCPKDMEYSITIFIEEEKENEVKTVHEFTYFYFLEKKDRWFRWLM